MLTNLAQVVLFLALFHVDLLYPLRKLAPLVSQHQSLHSCSFQAASAHIVLARDDRGGNLLLTGQDGGGRDANGDNLIIANDVHAGVGSGGAGQDSNLVLQDAANREGDVVISGKNLIIPGEDGHIVLADSRSNHNRAQPPFWYPPISASLNSHPLAYLWPFLSSRSRFAFMSNFVGSY